MLPLEVTAKGQDTPNISVPKHLRIPIDQLLLLFYYGKQHFRVLLGSNFGRQMPSHPKVYAKTYNILKKYQVFERDSPQQIQHYIIDCASVLSLFDIILQPYFFAKTGTRSFISVNYQCPYCNFVAALLLSSLSLTLPKQYNEVLHVSYRKERLHWQGRWNI